MGISLEKAAAKYRQGDPSDYSFLLALSVYLLMQKKGQVKIPKKVLQPLLTWMKKYEPLVRPKPETKKKKRPTETRAQQLARLNLPDNFGNSIMGNAARMFANMGDKPKKGKKKV